MQSSTFLLGFLVLAGICLQLGTCHPDDENDTGSIDATTITPETVSVSSPVENVPTKNLKSSMDECRTTRGGSGFCTRVSDCFKILEPETENGTIPVRNRHLAEMLVEASGFCTEGLKTREMTPTFLDEILRSSEVLLCCPEANFKTPETFGLDDIDKEADVYDEMFKGRNCGYNSHKEPTKPPTSTSTSTSTTTTSTAAPEVEIPAELLPLIPEGDRIVKGRKTKVGEYPWVVAMMNRGRQFCGGSLINQATVLTAAHCVQHMTASDVKNLKVQIGDWNIYKTGDVKHEVRGVKAVKYHKGFSMRHLQHDIALLILDTPVEYRDNIQPVCLHSGQPEVETGDKRADVAGWGALSEGGGQPPDMRAVTVRVLTRNQCVSRYSSTRNKIREGMVCAGDRGEDSCQGDSGGPLTIDSKNQAKQIGIVSWGIGCGRYPGVYTFIPRYLSWINNNMVRGMGYEGN